MTTETTNIISKFDRIYGGMEHVSLMTKASTVKNVQTITGKCETFIIQTCRHEEMGDYIFIETIDENGVTRLALPPKVASLIASQHDSLTKRRRSISSKAVMKTRMESGQWKGFTRKTKRKA